MAIVKYKKLYVAPLNTAWIYLNFLWNILFDLFSDIKVNKWLIFVRHKLKLIIVARCRFWFQISI